MSEETGSQLTRLRRQVQKSKLLVRQATMKVEDLEGSLVEIYNFKDRLVLFPRCATDRGTSKPKQLQAQIQVPIQFEEAEFLLSAA